MKLNIYTHKDFIDFDSAYWGLGSTSKEIFIALCSHDPSKSASLFSFNRKSKKIKKIFSLSELIENENNFLPEGKIHTPIFNENNKKLYFATHFAYPFGKPQRIRYQGGHIINFDLKTRKPKDLGIPVRNNGVLSMILDEKRLRIYGLAAPSHEFFVYDVHLKKVFNLGKISNGSICRSLVLDNVGNVYGAFEENNLFKFNYKKFCLEHLKVKLFTKNGKAREWRGEYRGGVNYIGRNIWRSAVWHDKTKVIYGIHAAGSELFSFDPNRELVKNLIFMGRSNHKIKLGQIYPTLSLCLLNDKIFYCFVNGFFDYNRSEKIIGDPALLSYDILKNKKTDHGSIKCQNRKIIGVAGSTITDDGILYLIGAVEVSKNEDYNEFNTLNGKGFNLSLIEINTNQLIYE